MACAASSATKLARSMTLTAPQVDPYRHPHPTRAPVDPPHTAAKNARVSEDNAPQRERANYARNDRLSLQIGHFEGHIALDLPTKAVN